MGIDAHSLNFLRFARKRQQFGRVATLGRQALALSDSGLARLLESKEKIHFGPYCEDLLIKYFEAACVESFDNSDYESPTHIVDMNQPLTIHNHYDTIIDGGCIEHIFNVTQALKNVSQMCSKDGQILHILPANNFCGHGFWQFSPELFFALYSEQNGYRETQVFLADLADQRFWYEVRKPLDGERANATSSTPVYVLVRTRKSAAFSHDRVQQSDYVYAWTHKETRSAVHFPIFSANTEIKEAIKASRLASSGRILHRTWRSLRGQTMGLSASNPNLVKLAVSSLV